MLHITFLYYDVFQKTVTCDFNVMVLAIQTIKNKYMIERLRAEQIIPFSKYVINNFNNIIYFTYFPGNLYLINSLSTKKMLSHYNK